MTANTLLDHLLVFKPIGRNAPYTDETPFDDTVYTYGTDFMLSAMTLVFAYQIHTQTPRSKLRTLSIVLMLLYSVSTLSGGISHLTTSFYEHKAEIMNSLTFRILWIICTGSVALPIGLFGVIGNALRELKMATLSNERMCTSATTPSSHRSRIMPYIKDIWWWLVSGFFTIAVAFGCFRCQRPAADIFVLGFMQGAFGMMYIFFLVLRGELGSLRNTSACLLICGLLGNCPLIFLYPITVLRGFPLPYINLYLHIFLFFPWSLQAVGLKSFCKQLGEKRSE